MGYFRQFHQIWEKTPKIRNLGMSELVSNISSQHVLLVSSPSSWECSETAILMGILRPKWPKGHKKGQRKAQATNISVLPDFAKMALEKATWPHWSKLF